MPQERFLLIDLIPTTSFYNMKIGIDIDGTIDTTKHLWELVKAHEVYFITTPRYSRSERVKQLKKLGIEGYKDIIIIEGVSPDWIGFNKAKWIKEHNIDMVFENSTNNLYYIKTSNPDVDCFLLV